MASRNSRTAHVFLVLSLIFASIRSGLSDEAPQPDSWVTCHELNGLVEFAFPSTPKKKLIFHGGGVDDVSSQYICPSILHENTAYLVYVEPVKPLHGKAQAPAAMHFAAVVDKMKKNPGTTVIRHVVEGNEPHQCLVVDAVLEFEGQKRESRSYHRLCAHASVTLSIVTSLISIDELPEATTFIKSFRSFSNATHPQGMNANLRECLLHWAAIDEATIRYYKVAGNQELDRDVLQDFFKLNQQLLDHRQKVVDNVKSLQNASKSEFRDAFAAIDPRNEDRLYEGTLKIVERLQRHPDLLQHFGLQISNSATLQKLLVAELERLMK